MVGKPAISLATSVTFELLENALEIVWLAPLERASGTQVCPGAEMKSYISFRPFLPTCTLVYILRRAFRSSSTLSSEKQEGEKTYVAVPSSSSAYSTPVP